MGILRKLRLYMMGFGIMMGLVFPLYAMMFVEFKPGMVHWFNAGCVLAGIMVGGFSFFIVNRILINKLNMLAEGYRAISQGDFSYRIDLQSPDSVGEIADGFNNMSSSLSSLISHLDDGIDKLSGVSTSLADFASGLESTIRDEGLNMARITTSTNQLSESIDDVNQNLESALNEARSIDGNATEVSGSLSGSMETMEEIEMSMMQTVQDLEGLNRRSSEISDIITLIDDIADQTNLLALNAAIEAARAGEQGRGFAVVADEVRKLAEKTTDSTRKIYEMISSLQENVQSTITNMDKHSELLGNLGATLGDSLKKLEGIVQHIRHSLDMIGAISSASTEQGAVYGEINQSLHVMEGSFGTMTGSIANMAAQSKEVKGFASTLKNEMDAIKGKSGPDPEETV